MIKFFNNKTTRLILLILGLLCIVNAILATVLSSLSLGVILLYVLGILLLGSYIKTDIALIQYIKALLLGIFALLLLYSIFVYTYGGNDNVTYEEDAVIVLGTVVIGDEPSTDLKNRLDATIEYHQQNPDALIIVTGGQGTDENDSEASVMSKYLINAGIPNGQIVMEDRATSTVENFKYSKEILVSKGFNSPKITYISNDFHIFRAGVLANNAGFEDVTHYHGKTPWYMIIPNGLRESIVTIKMWLID